MAKNITFVLIFLLTFSFSFVSSMCEKGQIDINSASAVELQKIKGIGPVYSERIVEERPFNSLDDLVRVKGIGEKTLQKIKEEGLACIGSGEAIEEENENEVFSSDEALEYNENNSIISSSTPLEKIENNSSVGKETQEGNIILNPERIENAPLLLNSFENSKGEELIYESKNSKILKYAPYAFSVFLILVIGFLVLSRG